MTDKEKQAIERLKSIDETTEEYDGNLFKADFETVLNLIEKKDKVIDFMAKRIREDSEWFYSDLDNKNENEIKEYFKKKVEDK